MKAKLIYTYLLSSDEYGRNDLCKKQEGHDTTSPSSQKWQSGVS